jgi:hypothetical protein
MRNKNMKFYYSPLSIGGVLLIVWGIWILTEMIIGAYPTYLAFILPIIGIGLLVLDFYIRKSKIDRKQKVLIQVISFVLILNIGYFFLKM